MQGCGLSDLNEPLFALQNPVTFGVLNSNSGGLKYAAMFENGGTPETSGSLEPFQFVYLDGGFFYVGLINTSSEEYCVAKF